MSPEYLRKLKENKTFKNFATVLAVYCIEVVVFRDIFRCPCRSHKSYGLTFLFVPAIVLLGLSLIVHQRSCSVLRTIWKHSNYSTRCNYFLSSLVDVFRPFLAPASWIVVALLRGECYACIRAGPETGCSSGAEKVGSVDFDHFYSQSFILGAACLIVMAIFAIGIVCIQRCCTNGYERLPTYDDMIEAKKVAVLAAFNSKTKEMAAEYAEKLVENSFHVREDSELDVDDRFLQARDKVQAMCTRQLASGYLVDFPFSSMEITSNSSM